MSIIPLLKESPVKREYLTSFAQGCVGANAGNENACLAAVSAYGYTQVERVVSNEGGHDVFVCWSPQDAFLFWKGETLGGSLLESVVYGGQVEVPANVPNLGFGYKVNAIVWNIEVDIFRRLFDALELGRKARGLDDLPMVYAGHGLGGATAVFDKIYRLRINGGSLFGGLNVYRQNPEFVYTFGSVRCLNPKGPEAFGSDLIFNGTTVYRVELMNDVVPTLPPRRIFNGRPVTFNNLTVSEYKHAGDQILLDSSGNLSRGGPDDLGSEDPFQAVLVNALSAISANPSQNAMATYLASLQASVSLPVPYPTALLPEPEEVPAEPIIRSTGMATYKLTYFFKQGPWGWSETFYGQANTPELMLTAATQSGLVNKRRALLQVSTAVGAYQPYLAQVRISDIAIQRDSLVKDYENFALPPGDSEAADIPNTALLVRWQSGSLYRRNQYVRGIPDNVVVLGGQYRGGGAGFTAKVNSYLAAIVAAGFGMQAITKPPVVPLQKITLMENVAGNVLVTMNGAHGLTTGQTVRIAGNVFYDKTENKKFNKLWKINIINSATTFTLLGVNIATYALSYGTMQPQIYAFQAFSDGIIERATHRITGRPFDEPRGRRRRKASA